jgi:biotin carboxyl carrier protein
MITRPTSSSTRVELSECSGGGASALRRLSRRGCLLIVSLAISGCHDPAAETTGDAASALANGATESGTPAKAEARSAATQWVPLRPPAQALMEVPARTVGDPAVDADVSALFPGQVRKLLVRAGDRVSAGAPVAVLAAPDLNTAAARVLTLKDEIALIEAREKALMDLRTEGLARADQVFDVQARLAALRAERTAALATLRGAQLDESAAANLVKTGTYTLTSPAGGVVVEVLARVGMLVDGAAGPLMRIRGEGAVRVEARLPFAQSPGLNAAFLTPGRAAIPLSVPPITSAPEPGSATYTVWFAPKEATTLPGGLIGRVVLTAATGTAFEVPARAIRYRPPDVGGPVVVVAAGAGPLQPAERAVRVLAASASSAVIQPADGAFDADIRIASDAMALERPTGAAP